MPRSVIRHPVSFSPSGRQTVVSDGATVLEAAEAAGEPVSAECAGRGACGRCLVKVLSGSVPEHCIERREAGTRVVLACLTPVHGPLTAEPLVDADLPHLETRAEHVGAVPTEAFAPWPLALDPIIRVETDEELGVAIDIGTTTLQLLVVNLGRGVVVGEASRYNPQIPRGADVISRIVAAEKGFLAELSTSVREAAREMIDEATGAARVSVERIRGYVVAGNVTMIHLLLGVDPSGIRRVPSEPSALAFDPVAARDLGWPGGDAPVFTIPAAGGWVGGDIVAGLVRAGFSRRTDGLGLYVDLGTNGEVGLGGAGFALACVQRGASFRGRGHSIRHAR